MNQDGDKKEPAPASAGEKGEGEGEKPTEATGVRTVIEGACMGVVDGCFRRSQAHVHICMYIHVYTRTHTNYAGTEGEGANGDVVLEEAEVSIAAQDEAEPEEEVGE